jgi:putative transport protein
MDLLSNSYFSLFLIIALGFLLGKVKIRGISLDVSAVIFVALVFGHYGVQIPIAFQSIGLVLFIFTIAIQAGPGFVQSFRKQGMELMLLAITLVGSAIMVGLGMSALFDIEGRIGLGLLTGALTSTPGLAVAIDTTHSPLASIGYGIAYPFGVLGVILFVRVFPTLFKIDLEKSRRDLEDETMEMYPAISGKHFKVENQNILGKTLGELKIRTMTGASISRVLKKGEAFTPTADTVLEKGNLIRAVGTPESLEKIELLVGPETRKEIPLSKNFMVQSVLVTNKKIINKTIGQLNLLTTYGATITRIRRSGIDIAPASGTQVRFGDKLMIACDRDHMGEVMRLIGNEDKRLSDTDFFPIATGIVLGVLAGRIQITFSDQFTFSLGLTGGILIVGLVLSNLGKTGPILWTMSGTANQLLRQLGLLFFLATVGTHAGHHFLDTFNEYGFKLFAVGAVITLIPMILAASVAHFVLKMNVFTLLGGLTGGMTSTPGLAALDSMSDQNASHLAYATIYPVAMVLIILSVQVVSYFI